MTRPNIILILADDMGYSDLGCYGSEIRTPNLDRLAASGLRFSQMYNSARCCPSRASLLTGLNPHQTGVGHMMDALGPDSYQGYLNQNCATIADTLRAGGYATYMSGKWHVGGRYNLLDDSRWEELKGGIEYPIPTQRGFDRFYGIVAGSANYYFPRLLMEDDRFIELDPNGYYFTDAITDNAVKMLDENAAANNAASTNGGDEKPFFLHVTYTAPHWPLHAHEEDIARYEGKYRDGWDTLRTNRHEELKASGILSDKWEISPRNASAGVWQDESNKDWEDLKMATYAAMIDRMDQGIGRILDKVREMGAEENTLVMFLSDNGGCAEFLAEDTQRPEPSQYASPNPNGTPIKMGNILGQRPGSRRHIHELRPAVGECEQQPVPTVQALDARGWHIDALHRELAGAYQGAGHCPRTYAYFRHHRYMHRSGGRAVSDRTERQCHHADRGRQLSGCHQHGRVEAQSAYLLGA